MEYLKAFLAGNPAALLFLVVGVGYLIGRIRIFGLDIGSVSGVLFAGLLLGGQGLGIPATMQSVGFVLFIFSVGLEAGPGFFAVLRADGLRYLLLAIAISGLGFTLALFGGRLLGLEPGASAGLLAGGMTSSPTLAAAQEALRAGQVEPAAGFTADAMMTNVTTAYAITYIFGLVGLILIIRLLPRFLGIDFPGEAAKLAAGQGATLKDETTAAKDVRGRAYRITSSKLDGHSLERIYEEHPGLCAVSRIRRNGELIEFDLQTELQLDDEITVVGPLQRLAEIGPEIGPELDDPEMLGDVMESGRVVVLRGREKKSTLTPMRLLQERACFLTRVQRFGVDIEIAPELHFDAGDVLHVTGYRGSLDRLGAELGHLERVVKETDLITFSLGIAVGLFVGTLSVSVAGISIGLGSAGGLLFAGLTIGYLRALKPTFGRVPAAARWVFMELGLLVFMAGVGLRAGGGILETLRESGAGLFLAGVTVTALPVFFGYFVGRKILKLNPVYLLGAITGSMTSGAALSIVNRAAGNSMPALGYTGAYAFANILLTVAGSIILLL